MSIFSKEIQNIITKNSNMINENIVGINYLEKIKYLIINNFKDIQNKSTIDNLVDDLMKKNNQSKKFEFKNQSLILSINLYKDSLSKIKSCYNNDTLFIVIEGNKIISLFDLHDKKKKISLSILKNMGLVLSENMITNENIVASSIIMDIILIKKAVDVEN